MNGKYTIDYISKALYDWGIFVASGGGKSNMLWYKQSSAYRLALPSNNKSYDVGFVVDLDIALGKVEQGRFRKIAQSIYIKTHANNIERAKELNMSIATFNRQKQYMLEKLVEYFNNKK